MLEEEQQQIEGFTAHIKQSMKLRAFYWL